MNRGLKQRWQVLVFDWDGTLMDSTAAIVRAAQAAIRELGLPERSPDSIRDIIGLGLRESWTALFPEQGSTEYSSFVESYREHFVRRERVSSSLYPGVADTLSELRTRGWRMAVATGKSRAGLDYDLQKTGLGGVFDATRTADETRSKPDPQMLRELMAALGSAPDATLMIGDTEYDLQMAQAAGVASLAITWGAHSEERLSRLATAACLADVGQIPQWLEQFEADLAQRS